MIYFYNVKELVEDFKEKIKREILEEEKKYSLLVLVKDPSKETLKYVKGKEKDCLKVGIECEVKDLSGKTNEEIIDFLRNEINNGDRKIIIQSPFGNDKHFETKLMNMIPFTKDADRLSAESYGAMCQGSLCYSATATGLKIFLLALTESVPIDLSGKSVVVVGRGKLAGIPCAKLFQDLNATVTVIHSKTTEEDKNFYLSNADIVVLAAGQPHMFKDSDFAENTIVIDAGTTVVDGKLCGDLDPESHVDYPIYATSVPGGVGLLTRVGLIFNIITG